MVTAVLLATVGYVGASFGILTNCTTVYNCTETLCEPCRGAGAWLDAGAAGQAVIAIAALAVAVTALVRGKLLRRVPAVGTWLLLATVAWAVLSTAAALLSF